MTRPSDTTPEAESLQSELYRAMTLGQKLALVLDLNDTADSFARAGLRLRHPEASMEEITLRLAAIKYGPDLVRRVYGDQPWIERTG